VEVVTRQIGSEELEEVGATIVGGESSGEKVKRFGEESTRARKYI
jgi:hypothetical protein